MKAVKKSGLLITFVLMTFFLNAVKFSAFSKPQNNPKADENFSIEKLSISNDLSNIKFCRSQVTMLNKECKRDGERGDKTALSMHKKELAKANADLSRSQAYLRADKADLKRDHRLAISERREA